MTFARTKLVSVAIVLVLIGLVKGQDPLQQAREAAKLNADKLKRELDLNFQDAARLERTSPEKARDLLRKNRLLLEDDTTALTDRDRKNYLNEIEIKLARINDRANSQRKADEIFALKAAEVRAFDSKLKADADRALRIGNPSVSGMIAAQQQQMKAQQLALLKAAKDMQNAAANNPNSNPYYAPPKSDKMAVPPGDLQIMKMLNSTTTANFKGQAMKDVLDFLNEKTGGKLNLIVDELGMKTAMPQPIDPQLFLNDPVDLSFKQPLKLRVILKMLLGPRGMDYYIEDGVLYVTKDTKAVSKMVVKSYPVSNLVGGQGLVDKAIQELQYTRPNPMTGQVQLLPSGQLLSQNIDGLTAQLMGAVEPDYWKVSNPQTGVGSMQFVPNTASLQIRASNEIHYLLMASGLLENVKR